jgi:hypothetical protein
MSGKIFRRPERRTRDGAVLLSHNHISLLQGLLDRPGARSVSKFDLISAAQPYIRRYRGERPSRGSLYYATSTLHSSWVAWKREGSRVVYRLRPRGRAILDGHVRARVAGFGEYVPGRVYR